MKKIIIFGGSGFIGSYFCEYLLKKKYIITIYDLTKPNFSHKSLKFIKGNIVNKNDVINAIKGHNFVMNFAGWADIETADSAHTEVIDQNVIGNLNILEGSRKHKVNKFVYASTMYVFSKYGGFYKASKQISEIIVNQYNLKFGLNFSILRFGSLYGPGSSKGNSIYDLITDALKNKQLNYWGSGEEIRQFIHARDAAKICDVIFNEKNPRQYLTVSGLEDIKIKDLLDLINETFDKKLKIFCKKNKKSQIHYKNTPFSVNNNIFQQNMGEKIIFKSYTDIRQGIYEMIAYLKNKK
jgi:UDP-glucose 4-epimerase